MEARETSSRRRRAASAAIVAEHPRWRGIRHPELLDFVPPRDERARHEYAAALHLALERLRSSAELYDRIVAVAAGVTGGRRRAA